MPRRARIVVGGYPMHVILRGIDRAAVFFADDDRRLLLMRAAALARAESVAVHAYVLMTNHVHLLLTAPTDAGVPTFMKRLAQSYVQYVNRTYRRTGPLFEGRFRSSVIETDEYLLACQRYIELNPLRAALVKSPADYPWSSYRANALGTPDPVVTAHPLYATLGGSDAERQAAYRRLFADEIDEQLLTRIRDSVNGGFVLGNARFERQIAAMLGRRTWRGAPGRPKAARPDEDQGDLPLSS
jgi:putative transposase